MDGAKHKIRKGTLFNRRMLDEHIWSSRNQAVSTLAIHFLASNNISSFHIFLPIMRNREVDTWPILSGAVKENRKVVVSATDFEREVMSHFHYTDQLKFVEDRFGIPTPQSGKPADLASLQLIFIPMLAGDKYGNRIGYGKGYYDRLLSEMPPELIKVGLTLNSLFDHFTFAEPHDINLDYCITPHEVVKCKR